MDVIFEAEGFSDDDRDEIDAVLQRIEDGETPGSWKGERPDVIRVRRRLTDGRSACEVLDVVARTGPREVPMVAKVGPIHELAGEWQAYQKYLSQASALFAPIRAATPAVLGTATSADSEREAVVYDHAARFAGLPEHPPETLEHLVRQAVRQGGVALERVERTIAKLFAGVRNDLYDKHEIDERETTAHGAWNLRLGVAAEVEVDHFDASSRLPVLDDGGGNAKRFYPATLLKAAARHDGGLEPGARVEVRGLRAEWWGERLMGRLKEHHLRLEVVSADGRPMRRVAAGLGEGESFLVRGRVRSVRARTHRERLLDGLPELETADGELLAAGDDGGRVADPFVALPDILETRRRGRLTAASILPGILRRAALPGARGARPRGRPQESLDARMARYFCRSPRFRRRAAGSGGTGGRGGAGGQSGAHGALPVDGRDKDGRASRELRDGARGGVAQFR